MKLSISACASLKVIISSLLRDGFTNTFLGVYSFGRLCICSLFLICRLSAMFGSDLKTKVSSSRLCISADVRVWLGARLRKQAMHQSSPVTEINLIPGNELSGLSLQHLSQCFILRKQVKNQLLKRLPKRSI